MMAGYRPEPILDRAGDPVARLDAMAPPPGWTWLQYHDVMRDRLAVEAVLPRDTPGDCVFMDESDGHINLDWTVGGLLPDYGEYPSLEVTFGCDRPKPTRICYRTPYREDLTPGALGRLLRRRIGRKNPSSWSR